MSPFNALLRFSVCYLALSLYAIPSQGADSPSSAEADSAPGSMQVAVRHVGDLSPYMGIWGSSVSRDGQFLAFVDWTTGDLSVRSLMTGENRRVTNKGPFHESVIFAEAFRRFSNNGQQLSYIWDVNGYELWVINLDGSNPRFVYRDEPEHGEMLLAFDWSADGKYVAAVVPEPGSPATDIALQISLIHVADGAVQQLKTLNGPVPEGQRMSFSPDGRYLAYDVPVKGDAHNRDIFVLGTGDSRDSSVVTHPADDRLLDWSPDGRAILFTSDRAGSKGVWLQEIDGATQQGVPRPVVDVIPEDIEPLGFTLDGDYYYGVSSFGQLKVYTSTLDLERGVVLESPAALARAGLHEAPEWSPDGASLAYVHNGTSIVVHSVESGAERSFVPEAMDHISTYAGNERYLRWSPDGRQIITSSYRTLYVVDVTTGNATPVVADGASTFGRWSDNGKEIFYVRKIQSNDSPVQIVRRNLETQHLEVLFTSEFPSFDVRSLEVSPDGRWLAFSDLVTAEHSNEVERFLMVMPAEGGEPRLLLGIHWSEVLNVVGWTPNSQEILFTRDSTLATKPSTTLWRMGLEGRLPRKLELGKNVLNSLRFHPDGKRVAFDSGQRGTQIWVIEDVLSVLGEPN